jgi:hypothetical protein
MKKGEAVIASPFFIFIKTLTIMVLLMP